MVATVFNVICLAIIVLILFEFAVLVMIAVHQKFEELNLKLLKYFRTKGRNKNGENND